MAGSLESKAGEVWNVNFDPHVGHELAGIRPAPVIAHDRFNRLPNDLHIVVPITGTNRGLAHHVSVTAPEGGLSKDSQIMCEQEKSQYIDRFIDRRGVVSKDTLRQVQTIVAATFDR